MIGILSGGIARIPHLKRFLGADIRHVRLLHKAKYGAFTAIAGWGQRPTTLKSRAFARRNQLPFIALEDGFLRSCGLGVHGAPPLSLVVDDLSIYYDATQPSRLEILIASLVMDVALQAQSVRALDLIRQHQLSKYNHAPARQLPAQAAALTSRVLVIDQTFGDVSVRLGGADASVFSQMLSTALSENPNAEVWIKTHPDVLSGKKQGYLGVVQVSQDEDARVHLLAEDVSPLCLLEQMDKVYVVTSQMGFEALMLHKPVVCFGLPWYAGWGQTDDRHPDMPALQLRRGVQRSLEELFAAAYLQYARYIKPSTGAPGTIFDVIGWLVQQREMAARYPGRMICVGFRRWKAANIKPLLSLDPGQVVFVPNVKAAEALGLKSGDCLIYWGREAPDGLLELVRRNSARMLRMEDGFVRSVGLGSDLIRPLSLVLDERGIYFDPTQPSELEHMLNTARFSEDEQMRARHVREFIVKHGITKYNLEPREKAAWSSGAKEVVLVPGQVEDDASIRYGCTDVKTNMGLLQAARRAHPTAFIVYKPHPDVMSGNRAGKLTLAHACEFADHVEARLSVVSCIAACDVVHTMTSLTGFDALLRGKRVVVYGQPFYAGWGLTEDVLTQGAVFARRQRRLTLDELVAGTLLRYPIYWDWDLKGYTSCEAVLHRIKEMRNALEASGGLEKLRVGVVRRQWRKLGILARAWGGTLYRLRQ